MTLILIKVLTFVMIAYLGVLIYMYLFQRSFTFQPSHADPFAVDYKPFEPFAYKTKLGLTLRGLYSPAHAGKPTIIYFQGNAGNIADRLNKTKYFVPKGYGFVLVGYRGYSGNPGMPSEEGLYDDARAAIGFIKSHGISEKDMIIYGESLGTGVAVQMATEHPDAKALILEAPFTSTVDVASRIYWFLPVNRLMRDRFDSASKIGKVKMPVFIIHGDKDLTIDHSFGKRLFGNVTSNVKKFITIVGAGHANLYDFKTGEEINAFLDQL